MTAELPGCSIALKCANDMRLFDCIASIDDEENVDVHVAVTPNDTIEGMLREREIAYTVTPYGNIARSAEISVREASHDRVIVMDSDTRFLPGSVRKLREALEGEDVFAKARMHFLTNSRMSELVARRRHSFYERPNYPSNPGLAMRRAEVREACGYIFNPKVRWTEDADLNYRAKLAGLSVQYVPEAGVMHDPVELMHELRAAFLYGVGKRLSIENTPGRVPFEEFPGIAISALKGALPGRFASRLAEHGAAYELLDLTWMSLYLAGYHLQKQTRNWSWTEDGV